MANAKSAECQSLTFSIEHLAFGICDLAALEPVPLEASVESGPAQAERLRRLADVAVEPRHRLLGREAFDVFEAHVFQASAAGVLAGAQPEVGGLDERPRSHQHGALDGMVEFADVARPIVFEERLHRAALETGQPFSVALRMLTKEVLREQGQILTAIAQGRQPDLDRVQAEEQILTEPA